MADDTEWSDKTKKLYEELNQKVNEYFMSIFEDNGDLEVGDYIDSWAISAHASNVGKPFPTYVVECFPLSTPPHSVKGLFNEGIDIADE